MTEERKEQALIQNKFRNFPVQFSGRKIELKIVIFKKKSLVENPPNFHEFPIIFQKFCKNIKLQSFGLRSGGKII